MPQLTGANHGKLKKEYKLQDILIYDCETRNKGTFKDPQNTMGFLCGCIYSYNRDTYFIFDNSSELIRALNGNICASFNGINFDTRLLLGNNRKYRLNFPYFKIVSRETYWLEYDIFLIVLSSFYGIKLSESVKKKSPGGLNLNDLCKMTLNKQKISINFNTSNFIETIEYCLHDIRITRKLFEFFIKNGYLRSPKQGKIRIPLKYRENIKNNPSFLRK